MYPERFAAHAPSRLGITANLGISLCCRDDRYVALPNYPADEEHRPYGEFALPTLSEIELSRALGLLKTVWRCTSRCATWLLYLDLQQQTWRAWLPPQWCGPDATRLNVTFPKCDVPGPHLRLAGSLRCSPGDDLVQLAVELPPRDGIHLIWCPDDWHLTAFVISGEVPLKIAPDAVIEPAPSPEVMQMHDRLWMVDRM